MATSSSFSLSLPSLGSLNNPFFGPQLADMRARLKAAEAASSAAEGQLDKATTSAEASTSDAYKQIMDMIQNQAPGPMMPVHPMMNPFVSALSSLSAGLATNMTGNGQFLAQDRLTQDQWENQRQQAIQSNVGYSRDQARQKHMELLQVQMEQAHRLATKAAELGSIQDQQKYTAQFEKAKKLLDDYTMLQTDQAKDYGATQRTSIAAKGGMFEAAFRAAITGQNKMTIDPLERSKALHAAISSNVDAKTGRVGNTQALQSDILLVPPSTGQTFEQWKAEMLGLQAAHGFLGGPKPLFDPKNAHDNFILNNAANIWFPTSTPDGTAPVTPPGAPPTPQPEEPQVKALYQQAQDAANELNATGALSEGRRRQAQATIEKVRKRLNAMGYDLNLMNNQAPEVSGIEVKAN